MCPVPGPRCVPPRTGVQPHAATANPPPGRHLRNCADLCATLRQIRAAVRSDPHDLGSCDTEDARKVSARLLQGLCKVFARFLSNGIFIIGMHLERRGRESRADMHPHAKETGPQERTVRHPGGSRFERTSLHRGDEGRGDVTPKKADEQEPPALLPISDARVFAKIAQEHPDICHKLAERLIGAPTGSVTKVVSEDEESTLDARGVRFGVYIEGEQALVDVEMQTTRSSDLSQRAACYRAVLTRRGLRRGENFAALSRRYVVFICTFDPFGCGWARYSARTRIKDEMNGRGGFTVEDGETTLFYNAAGFADCDDPGIAHVLEYVQTGRADGDDGLVAGLEWARVDVQRDERWVKTMSLARMEKRSTVDAAFNAGVDQGFDQGFEQGATNEHARTEALIEAMQAQGRSLEDFASAFSSGDRDMLNREYGIG